MITAGTISGNKGSESMFTAIYQNLLRIYPDSHFWLLSYYPEKDRKYKHTNNITILPGTPSRFLFLVLPLAVLCKLFRMLRIPTRILEREPIIGAITRSNIFLDIGGITFAEGREIYLPFNVVTILPAILMKKRTIKCAQAMGPFNRFLNKNIAKLILPKIDLIFARSKKTMGYLNSIGLRNTMLAADIAFSMSVDDVVLPRIEKYLPAHNSRIVGISPSSVVYKYCKKKKINYTDIMARFCEYLMQKWHFNIIMVPHSIRKDSNKLKNNDLPVIYKIIDSIPDRDKLIVVDEDLSASEIKSIIGNCDFFIASRFHSMVSALSSKVPLIVCGWGHKYLEVLESFGLEGYAFDYKNLSFETIVLKFEQLIQNEADTRERINNSLPNVLSYADKHFDKIKQIIRR